MEVQESHQATAMRNHGKTPFQHLQNQDTISTYLTGLSWRRDEIGKGFKQVSEYYKL